MEKNTQTDFEWNEENKKTQNGENNSQSKNNGSDRMRTFLNLLEEKIISLGTTALKSGVRKVAMNKLHETEEKVMHNIDSKISTYKSKAIFGVLILVGSILLAYSFFEIFFSIIKHPEWTNFGAGLFFIFVGLIVYAIDSMKKK